MGERAADPALVFTNPAVQQCNLRHKPFSSLPQDRPCVFSNYIRPEVSLFKRNTAYIGESTLNLRCQQSCRRTPQASEVEG